ncbi:helix-turn-helix domain-containing protein [Spirosoma sp. KNUC1025]|uniref:helix-turn-helix domain-containing protein n=1 Tax=Spirosoma sp. KNUC1025 TaxID=2894082 RepID=UPI001E5A16B8|nr:helix-turn-helix domain-containing protein [Spirosoma sp. KNUC1025]UFH57591.1 helix-turn-helix domain-containing protein [Spirosoma sp. KNUC1025]
MIFRAIRPCPALQPYIKNYLLVNLVYHPVDFPKTPYPARLEQALVFFVRGLITSHDPVTGKTVPIAANALFGQQVSRLDFQCIAKTDFLMVQVVFQPGALYHLLGIPSTELTGVFCDGESVLSSELQTVNDQLANANDYTEMIERVEQYMVSKLKKVRREAHPIDRIGKLLLDNPVPFSLGWPGLDWPGLDWLAGQANLSPRQFERKFSERMGIGPKLYSRISRFFQTITYKERHPDQDWLTVAVEFGYTDYNHLAKDFKQFAHVTPNVLMNEYAQRPEIIVNL